MLERILLLSRLCGGSVSGKGETRGLKIKWGELRELVKMCKKDEVEEVEAPTTIMLYKRYLSLRGDPAANGSGHSCFLFQRPRLRDDPAGARMENQQKNAPLGFRTKPSNRMTRSL
jgi:hypothetical protein